MKNFVKHIFAIAICAAALLSSCIKEETYVTQDVLIDVTLTRAGTTSEQQGDQIEDIMLWAFERNSDGSINNNPVGWRQFKAPNPTFTKLSLHLPVKMCGTDGANYRIIAVLNTQKFTDVKGNAISFNGTTTYTALTTGKFVSKAVMDSAIVEDMPGTPAVMPISHWADVDVAQSNVHDNNACASVSIDVFRTVAKTQFFMGGKSGAEFDLKVTKLSLHCGAMPTDGLILSSLAPDDLNNKNTTPAWFGDSEPTIVGSTATDADKTITLVAADAADVAVDGEDYFHENRPVIADNETAADHYMLIGSHFLYENPEGFTFIDNATSAPEGDGYYYEVVYEADNQEYTRYVALPSILRNHDYQIHALVEGGSGELTFWIEVNQWVVEEEEINYQDIATLSENGHIMWLGSTLNDGATDITLKESYKPLPNGETINELGQVTATASILGAERAGVINLTAAQNASATFKFALETPVGGTWIAELRTIGNGDTDDIVFGSVNGTNLWNGTTFNSSVTAEGGPLVTATPTYIEGNIDNQPNVITIKNLVYNSATAGDPENIVELHIYAKAYWGTVLRSYRVDGIVGTGVSYTFYTLKQPQGV